MLIIIINFCVKNEGVDIDVLAVSGCGFVYIINYWVGQRLRLVEISCMYLLALF
jgi:hypothetical protein